jgi:uncharacterized protein YjbI with pentapeptide repeats
MLQSQSRYTDQTFEGVRCERGEIDSSEFHGCTFRRCSFVESVFRRCRFVDCTFMHSDLSLVQLPGSVFRSVRFEESKLVGVDWTQADWSGVWLGDPPEFHACTLSHATFIGLNLHGIQFKGCAAVEVDFREADLSSAAFGGTDLSGSLFQDTKLSKADLSEACNYDIAPEKNDLRGAKFSLPEAMSLLYNLDIELVDR